MECLKNSHEVDTMLDQVDLTKQIKEQENISEKIYKFAMTKIKKLVISESDSNKVYALISKNGHTESLDLSNKRALHWLRWVYNKKTGKNYSEDNYQNALTLIKSQAIMNETKRETIYNRVAMVDDSIFYDLATFDWKAVKITKNNVEVVNLDETTPIFTRKQHQSLQKFPEFTDDDPLDDLVKLLRIKNEDYQFFKVHLIEMFLEEIPVPIMVVIGEQGTIKTTLCKTVKRIIDPSGENVSSLPRKTEDLLLNLYSRYLVHFDNVSGFNQEVSDIFCRAITGEGISKRRLYTDAEEVIWNYQRKIVINGIAPSLEYPDLRERCIIFETTPVRESERLTEEEFEKKFQELLPRLLGQIFKILSSALALYEPVKSELKNLPRMADYTIFGECISRVLGCESFSFVKKYRERLQLNATDVVETYPLIPLLENLMNNKNEYENTVAKFYKEIIQLAQYEEVDIDSRYAKFPAAPNKVRQHIQKLKPTFRILGFEINISQYTKRDGKHPKNRHVIYITKIHHKEKSVSENRALLPSLPSLPAKIYEHIPFLIGSCVDSDNFKSISKPLPQRDTTKPENNNGKDGNRGTDTSLLHGGKP